jgi:hypothetical protein
VASLILSNPLGMDDAQQLGLAARDYEVGEIVTVDDWAGTILIRTGYGRDAGGAVSVTMLEGEGPPYPGLGGTGVWYLDTLSKTLYGPKRPDGTWPTGIIQPGRGIASTAVSGGHLLITYTDGAVVDVGNVAGPPGSGTSMVSTGITDSTVVGRQVLTAATAAAARSAIGAGTSSVAVGPAATDAKAGNWVPASTDISDATATGRSVLTAATAAAARTAIGAGTSSLAVGTAATDAKAGNYQPTAANITDATATGRSVLTAVDAATARGVLGAGTSSLVIGTTAGTAKDGAYQPTSANITDATAAATANTVVKRDAAGRFQAVSPSAASDVSIKSYADALGVSTATASTIMRRDAAGRAQVVDPSVAADIATKNYADTGDTAAKARANHTGTQVSATLSDLTETVQDIVGAFISAGTGLTVTYDDVANTFVINVSGGGPTDPEVVRDTIGAALVAGAGVQITVNDAGDTITIASTAVLPTRQVIAGTGLTGGGDLSADRTLAVAYGTIAATAVQGNDARVTADQAPAVASIRTLGTGTQQAAAGNHTHTSTAITDSTTVGRSVLTAVDAPTARTAIGAGTSSLAVGPAATDAKAGNYQPAAANITDSTATGRALLTAADAATGRGVLGTMLGTGITEVQKITQVAYTALGAGASATTLYLIVG